MAYTPEQIKVAKRIKRIGKKRGESKKHINANLAIGIVESNLRNLSYGDADSQGYRQERASLYKNPTNLKAAINRAYDEMDQLDRGQGAGQLAADIQRPAAQYRGRYGEVLDQAKALRRSLSGVTPGGGSRRRSGKVTKTTRTVTPDTTGARAGALLAYAANRDRGGALTSLVGDLGEIEAANQPRTTVTKNRTPGSKPPKRDRKGPAANGKGLPQHRDPKNLLELFWQGAGGVNVKHGARQPMGFVDGHTDHVHVAANAKAVVKLGKLAQSMGLRVSENKNFDPVDPVHTSGSYHYSNRAIDVSGDPVAMRKFANKVARIYGVK